MYEHYKKRGIPWPFKETNPETSILTTSITTIAHETNHKSETNTDKITTFGYIRQIQNKYNINVPYDVANICYMYYFSGLFCKLSEFKNIDQMEESIFADEETIQMVDYLTQIVLDPYTNNLYALKVSKKTECSKLIAERKMLEKLDNPFIVKLYKTFTDSCNIFTVFDGGFGTDLFSLLRANKCFNEKTARFYAACVIEAFVYLHSKNIIYRYLKPESIILEKNGYIKLKDLVLAKQVTNKTYTLCGTPDYLAPEIVQGQGHDKGVDWWTLGIFIYEMLASYPPFYDDDAVQTYRNILSGIIRFPKDFNTEVRNLIRGFLKFHPNLRLGMRLNSVNAIRRHEWFSDFKWEMLNNGSMEAPCFS